MDTVISEFIHVLRKAGVRISISEELDAFQAIAAATIKDRPVFKAVLASTLIKRSSDLPAFESLFNIYFSGVQLLNGIPSSTTTPFGDFLESLSTEELNALEAFLPSFISNLLPLTRYLLTDNRGEISMLFKQAGEAVGVGNIKSPMQVGIFRSKILRHLQEDRVQEELDQLQDQADSLPLRPESLEALQAPLQMFAREVPAWTRKFVEQQLEMHNYNALTRFREETLMEKNLYTLTEDDIKRMREVVNRLARRLKSVLALRKKHVKRGKFDMRKTIRLNLRYGGVPFEVAFKDKRIDRPQVAVLCDISESVSMYSKFMLQFVYTLQEEFSKVRSFVFVSDLTEVTHLFKEHEINEALSRAAQGEGLRYYPARTDYGEALEYFSKKYLDCVNKKTTVIFLGDARSNYTEPRVDILRTVNERAKQVLWLNPESPSVWGFGDSCMKMYSPYCDKAYPCRSLKDLARVVDSLFQYIRP